MIQALLSMVQGLPGVLLANRRVNSNVSTELPEVCLVNHRGMPRLSPVFYLCCRSLASYVGCDISYLFAPVVLGAVVKTCEVVFTGGEEIVRLLGAPFP